MQRFPWSHAYVLLAALGAGGGCAAVEADERAPEDADAGVVLPASRGGAALEPVDEDAEGADVPGDADGPARLVSGGLRVEPRMSARIYHPSVHMYTTGDGAAKVTAAARRAKTLAYGDSTAPTCWVGPGGTAQLAVQTEFVAPEFAGAPSPDEALARLDERLDALFAEGLAVHLLLPINSVDGLPDKWQGVDWVAAQAWSNSSAFMPMKPCAEAFVDGEKCPYDVFFDEFQRPVIEHLVATGRAGKLAVIYVANEFGFHPTEVNDTAADWGNTKDWQVVRAVALAQTARRALDKARSAAAGAVPVGLKFVMVENVKTGWAKDPEHGTDQLAYILDEVMAPGGDVIGYDTFFGGPDYDVVNRERLGPFLPAFANGRMALTEFARFCEGSPGVILEGSRTTADDIVGAAAVWPYEAGINLFALNSSDCNALVHPGNIDVVFDGADKTAHGLWLLTQAVTGTATPTPCDCSDGDVEAFEQCDGVDLGGESCESLGWDGGSLACLPSCTFDTSGCFDEPASVCGDGKTAGDEVCDGEELGGQTCASMGWGDGKLGCTATCALDPSGCSDAPVCVYDVAPGAPSASFDAPYACPGSIVMPISGAIDPETGALTVSSPGKPGDYGPGTYRVLAFDPEDDVEAQCKPGNAVMATLVVPEKVPALGFPAFASQLECFGPHNPRAYCIAKQADQSFAHFCSGRLVAAYE